MDCSALNSQQFILVQINRSPLQQVPVGSRIVKFLYERIRLHKVWILGCDTTADHHNMGAGECDFIRTADFSLYRLSGAGRNDTLVGDPHGDPVNIPSQPFGGHVEKLDQRQMVGVEQDERGVTMTELL